MEKKYRFTEDIYTNCWGTCTLHRIQALRDFGDVKKGDLGGWIEKEENLSHEGSCWVYDNAKIIGKVKIFGDAKISGNSILSRYTKEPPIYICGHCQIKDGVEISGDVRVFGNAIIKGETKICAYFEDKVRVYGDTVLDFDKKNVILGSSQIKHLL